MTVIVDIDSILPKGKTVVALDTIVPTGKTMLTLGPHPMGNAEWFATPSLAQPVSVATRVNLGDGIGKLQWKLTGAVTNFLPHINAGRWPHWGVWPTDSANGNPCDGQVKSGQKDEHIAALAEAIRTLHEYAPGVIQEVRYGSEGNRPGMMMTPIVFQKSAKRFYTKLLEAGVGDYILTCHHLMMGSTGINKWDAKEVDGPYHWIMNDTASVKLLSSFGWSAYKKDYFLGGIHQTQLLAYKAYADELGKPLTIPESSFSNPGFKLKTGVDTSAEDRAAWFDAYANTIETLDVRIARYGNDNWLDYPEWGDGRITLDATTLPYGAMFNDPRWITNTENAESVDRRFPIDVTTLPYDEMFSDPRWINRQESW